MTPGLTARIGAACIGQKACPVGGDELIRETCPHALGAETAEIEVEVAVNRHELADFDAGGDAAFVQPFRRPETGRVVVAGDIEPAQSRGRGEVEGGEVVGRERRQSSAMTGSTDLSASMVSTPSPAARMSAACAEAHAIAKQMAEGAARIGEWRLRRHGADRARCAECR